jgi:uncharacterized membrane protein
VGVGGVPLRMMIFLLLIFASGVVDVGAGTGRRREGFHRNELDTELENHCCLRARWRAVPRRPDEICNAFDHALAIAFAGGQYALMALSLRASRMEAFSDRVFSIAATLLVLDLALHPPGTPLAQFLHEWPGYLGYAISFLTIGAAWLGHDAITDRLPRVDSLLLRINLLLLFVIAFLPFPTRLIAEAVHDTNGERVFVTIYGLTLLTIRLLLTALDAYARRADLYTHGEADEELRTERRQLWPVLAGYGIAILIGLAAPTAAVLLYLALAVFLVVPFRDIRRLLFRHS